MCAVWRKNPAVVHMYILQETEIVVYFWYTVYHKLLKSWYTFKNRWYKNAYVCVPKKTLVQNSNQIGVRVQGFFLVQIVVSVPVHSYRRVIEKKNGRFFIEKKPAQIFKMGKADVLKLVFNEKIWTFCTYKPILASLGHFGPK